MSIKTLYREFHKLASRLKPFFFGTNRSSGALAKLFIYALLISIGFVYIYPLLYMLINSIMNNSDLVDPSVSWIPSSLTLDNFKKSLIVLDYGRSLTRSLIMSLGPAVLQTISLAVISYGLARFNIPLKRFWIVMIVLVFVIPVQITMIPRYVLFESYGFVNTILPFYIPAIFGQGIKSSIFILIYYQFFTSYPKALDEAAYIDGAGPLRVFFKVALPMVRTAMLVTFLFSFIWYWNETMQAGLFFGSEIQTLPMRLQNFVESYSQYFATNDYSTTNRLNESIRLAGTLLTILPLIIIYIPLQRYFIEGIENTGLTGE